MRDVVRVTWNWQDPVTPRPRRHSGRLRRDAVVQALVMGVVGTLLVFVLGHVTVGRIVWLLAGVVLLLGLLWPAGYRPIHAFGNGLGRAVGTVLRYLLLVPGYWLVFVPGHLLLRLRGRDPLQRKYYPATDTYWIPRPAKTRDANIADQFLREDRDLRLARRPVGACDWTEQKDQR